MVEEKVETEELPTMEGEPKAAKAEEKTEVPTTDLDALVAELEKAGVTNTEQLQGKLVASREAGNLSNQLGDARREIAELREFMASNQSKPTGEEFEETSEGNDLEGVIAKVLEKHDRKKLESQTKVQKAVNAMWEEISTDEDYHLVEEIWENKLKDPKFTFQIQQGQLNPVKAYNNVVRAYYKGIAKKSVDTIKTLQGGGKTPPHVEQGGTQTPGVPKVGGEPSKSGETLEKLTEKVNKGSLLTEQEELAAIGAALTK